MKLLPPRAPPGCSRPRALCVGGGRRYGQNKRLCALEQADPNCGLTPRSAARRAFWKVGDWHGESPGRSLAHHLLWCQSRRGGHAVPSAMFTACGIPDLHGMGPSAAVASPMVAGDGVRPVGCPCPGAAGNRAAGFRFPGAAPGSSRGHRAARCAPRGAAPALARAANGSKAGPATVHHAPRRAKRHAVAHCRAR